MRRFSAYELNILHKHNIDPTSVSDADIPVEYLVGEGEFCEYSFKVTKDTLIPRVESEYLIELGLRFVNSRYLNFADVGCGSGAIGLTFAMELAKRNVMFSAQLSDLSQKALEITNQNYVKFKGEIRDNKILIFKSDLLKAYSKANKLDLVFANLPYIPSERIAKLDKSVREYEPHSALDGGQDGLHFIREFLSQAPDYLTEDARVILEVDDSHKDASEFSSMWNIEIKNDFNGKVRYWVCSAK